MNDTLLINIRLLLKQQLPEKEKEITKALDTLIKAQKEVGSTDAIIFNNLCAWYCIGTLKYLGYSKDDVHTLMGNIFDYIPSEHMGVTLH